MGYLVRSRCYRCCARTGQTLVRALPAIVIFSRPNCFRTGWPGTNPNLHDLRRRPDLYPLSRKLNCRRSTRQARHGQVLAMSGQIADPVYPVRLRSLFDWQRSIPAKLVAGITKAAEDSLTSGYNFPNAV